MVLTDQVKARDRVAAVVASSSARGGGHRARLAVLGVLVAAMDYTEGHVVGLTHALISARSGVPERTVSSVLAWARAAELVVTVESPVSAAVMGTAHGRTAVYVLVTPHVDDHGDPPPGRGWERKPSGRGQEPAHHEPRTYPAGDRARSASERGRASDELLNRLGVPRQHWTRGRALLSRWWIAGACVSGLLHATRYSPDGHDRALLLRGARHPLGVLAARLSAWDGRLDELPARVQAVDPDARRARRARLDADLAQLDDAGRRERPAHVQTSTDVRAAVMAQLRAGRDRR